MKGVKGRGTAFLTAALAAFFALLAIAASVQAAALQGMVSARSAVLMDAATGRVLWQRAPRARMYPASTTKVATAIVAIEKGRPSAVAKVSPAAVKAGGSSAYLEAGESITQEELLLGAMLASGNDACLALAEAVSGSVDEFVGAMNEMAAEVGATDTHFVNPNGLPDPEHYTTAYDLAVMTRHAMTLDAFRRVVSTKEAKLPPTSKGAGRSFRNHNRLLWEYGGADGVKTGYTKAAGKCLIASATRDGQQLIAVILDSDNIWTDSKAMLDWGFEHYALVRGPKKGDVVKTYRLIPNSDGTALKAVVESDVAAVVKRRKTNGAEALRKVVRLRQQPKAPVRKGQVLGSVELIASGGDVVASSRVIAGNRVREQNRAQRLWGLLVKVLRLFT